MTTRLQLQERIQNQLSDATGTIWSDAVIVEWLNDAIRDFSTYLPRITPAAVALTAGDPRAELPDDFISLVSIYYNDQTNDPYWLTYKSRQVNDGSFDGPDYYDIEPSLDVSQKNILHLSFDPIASSTAVIRYYASHAILASDSEDVTVQPQHEPILVQYVLWRAYLERTSNEMQNPDSTSLVVAQMAQNAAVAERTYRAMVREAKNNSTQQDEPRWARWQMDNKDRIY